VSFGFFYLFFLFWLGPSACILLVYVGVPYAFNKTCLLLIKEKINQSYSKCKASLSKMGVYNSKHLTRKRKMNKEIIVTNR
jgi:hypothetical protein